MLVYRLHPRGDSDAFVEIPCVTEVAGDPLPPAHVCVTDPPKHGARAVLIPHPLAAEVSHHPESRGLVGEVGEVFEVVVRLPNPGGGRRLRATRKLDDKCKNQ